ncbi:MAG TPA: CRTAC1 family protein [Vicinamibacteria bacterium]|nr:CRTAC1 family protein [Vicinamibacteria bacterium]
MRLVKRKKLMALYGGLGLGVTVAGAGVVLWLERSSAAYRPGEDIEGITSTLSRDLPEDRPSVVFEDVTKAWGVSFQHFGGTRSTQLPEDMGSGAAFGDFDNDGYPDLYLVNIAGPLTAVAPEWTARNRLYHNEGGGRFRDVSEPFGVDAAMAGMGAAWGDFDADGYLDLVVTGFSELKLFRNVDGRRFDDVTESTGLSQHRGFWTGASWGDYDGDGDLDLYVCGYVRYVFRAEDASRGARQYQAVVPYTLNPSSYPPERNLLFRNEGDGRFTEVAEALDVHNPEGRSLAASWCDFDEDGDLDLYVANDVSDNVLYRNGGEGGFEDVSHPAWVADYRGAMGLAVGDWDLDSDQDLFVTHWMAQENALYSNLKVAFGSESDSEELRFMDVADTFGLGQIALDYVGWATFFFDYDNDGRPDLFVANGSTFQDEGAPSELVPMTSSLFWNGGVDRGFFDLAPVSGRALAEPHVTRGAAAADIDRDGDLDLVLVNHGEAALVLRNDGGNGHAWLDVEVRSRGKNRFGVGAKVSVYIGEKLQTIHIGAQASYLSQNPYTAHFGLGENERVDKLTVVFPGGGRVEREDVPVRQHLVIEEPS